MGKKEKNIFHIRNLHMGIERENCQRLHQHFQPKMAPANIRMLGEGGGLGSKIS